MQQFVPGIYEHYKNGERYMGLMVVENEGTRELKVVYIPLYPTHKGTSRGFERPLKEWQQEMEFDDGRVLERRPRYRLITPITDAQAE